MVSWYEDQAPSHPYSSPRWTATDVDTPPSLYGWHLRLRHEQRGGGGDVQADASLHHQNPDRAPGGRNFQAAMTRIPIAFLTEPRAPLDHGAVVALARELLSQHKFWDEHADPESAIVE